MGKEWNWTRSFKRGGNAGDTTKQRNHPANSAGCMGSMLHVFDLHRILFFSGSSRSSSTPAGGDDDTPRPRMPTSSKGLQAPRNSLELDEAPPSTASPYDLQIPLGIKLRGKRREEVDEEDDGARSSGGSNSVRTGNLVARLMGLDHLPADHRASFSPRSSTNNLNRQQQHQEPTHQMVPSPTTHKSGGGGGGGGGGCRRKSAHKRRSTNPSKNSNGGHSGSKTPPPRHPLQPKNSNIVSDVRHGTRSLPETPRISLTKLSWDSDPRLSSSSSSSSTLRHNNKENMENMLTPSAILELKSICADHSSMLYSPLVSETRGTSVRSKGKECAREIVRQVKDSVSRRVAGNAPRDGGGSRSTLDLDLDSTDRLNVRSMRKVRSSFSCERNRLQEPKSEEELSPTQVDGPTRKHQAESPPEVLSKSTKNVFDVKCKKASLDRFTERLKKPPSQPRRNALISPSPGGRSKPAPVWSHGRRHDEKVTMVSDGPIGKEEEEEEVTSYVKKVLRKSGFYGSNPCSVRWHSLSHPLGQALFHQVELHHYYHGSLRHRCNRKLLFDLVEELLAETFWPFVATSASSSCQRRPPEKDALLEQVVKQITGYPSAVCEVMEDIDALVELDLPEANVRRLLGHPAVAEEREDVAAEVEGALLDSLLEDSVREL